MPLPLEGVEEVDAAESLAMAPRDRARSGNGIGVCGP